MAYHRTKLHVEIESMKNIHEWLVQDDGTVDRDLQSMLLKFVGPQNSDGAQVFDEVFDEKNNLKLRVYKPTTTNSSSAPVLVFFHGGCFVHHSYDFQIYDDFCRHITLMSNFTVVSVDYRKAPEHPFPCAYEDGFKAVTWLQKQPWLKNADLFLIGNNSGGNIIHHVAVMASEKQVKISGLVMINPMFGGTNQVKSEEIYGDKEEFIVDLEVVKSYWAKFLPEGADTDHPASNPFGPKSEFQEGIKFPKTLVVLSEMNPLLDRQMEYVNGLRRNGKEVKHVLMKEKVGFFLRPRNKRFFEFVTEMLRLILG